MTLLPIAERELRMTSRRILTYQNRFVVCLMALMVFMLCLATGNDNMPSARMGGKIFYVLSTLAFVYVLLAGIHWTSDCISREKREGTLGLLFLTDLRGVDVVLGKLTASSTKALCGLMGVLPIIAIPLLMGGISGEVFVNVACTLIVTLCFSLCSGILVSTLSQTKKRAGLATFLLLSLFSALIPLIGITLSNYLQIKQGLDSLQKMEMQIPFLVASPIFSFAGSLSWKNIFSGVPVGTNLIWFSIAVQISLSLLFLAAASHITRNIWIDRPPGILKQRWEDRWQRWCHGSMEFRNQRRKKLLEINPFLWLFQRNRYQFSLMWGGLSMVGVCFFWKLFLLWKIFVFNTGCFNFQHIFTCAIKKPG